MFEQVRPLFIDNTPEPRQKNRQPIRHSTRQRRAPLKDIKIAEQVKVPQQPKELKCVKEAKEKMEKRKVREIGSVEEVFQLDSEDSSDEQEEESESPL